uniref:CSON012984 protein n=1 Tax=Culicoides sonorensis TaxID=179676 RepID=A0A336K1L0_CULSO
MVIFNNLNKNKLTFITLWSYFNTQFAIKPVSSVQICDQFRENIQMASSGTESSVIVDFNLNYSNIDQPFCQKTFISEPRHAFFLRVYRYDRPQNPMLNDMQIIEWSKKHLPRLKKKNDYTCPLEIKITNNTVVPTWKIDPCQLEFQNFMEISRYHPGQLTLTWENNGFTPAIQVLITVLGQGEVCNEPGNFVCLGIGEDPVLCIADELMCDGVIHCPNGIDMRNDEDPAMCFQNNRRSDIWQILSFNALKHVLGYNNVLVQSTTLRPDSVFPRQKSTITRGLAKYGPWGYLMLGLIICGSALVMCSLWECCCRRFKTEFDDSNDSIETLSNIPPENSNVTATAPPNYEELESPPSYTVLFPITKNTDSTVNNNNSAHNPNMIYSSYENSSSN